MRVMKVVLGVIVTCGAMAATWAMFDGGPTLVVYGAVPDQERVSTDLDRRLATVLRSAGFTGRIEATLEARLGRRLDRRRADLGRLLFFDNRLGLHEDNSCAGCHSPAFGFGDSQSIAIGVQNNGIVGPDRRGPRNQRKAPVVINSAFFPRLMLNGRFAANSGDPFDNSSGFMFPRPEGDALKFGPRDPEYPTLLTAQAHIPSTELVEMAGFNGASRNPFFASAPHLHQFDDGLGTRLPRDTNQTDFPDPGFLNEEIRAVVLGKLNRVDEYVVRFADVFNDGRTGGFRITFPMVGQAIAEFEMTLTLANAPIDRFARGDHDAMTRDQKRGALLFFGRAHCVSCHRVRGLSNEMFSDFDNHVLGVPQIAPVFGVGAGNVVFDGPGQDEDFGAEQVTGDQRDRYKFRTSPLRNVGLQPAFFHDGAFTRLDDAIRHHLDVVQSARTYNPAVAGVDGDLTMGPIDAALDRLDRLVQEPTVLSRDEFLDLFAFVRDGLLDPRAKRANTCKVIPRSVPSALPVSLFQGCP
jgi:cytochrome c peroxidase